jgi:carboxymethylenebutenolidase
MQMFEQGFAPTDLLAARAWVPTLAPSAKIGLTGFCAGGGIALRRLIGSRAFAAASIFYGDVRPAGTPRDAATTPSMFDYTTQIETPVMGNYGARDTSIKAADVQAMFERLTMPHDLKIYPEAGHAFFDDERTSYVATAATDAWTRTLSWFHRYLS